MGSEGRLQYSKMQNNGSMASAVPVAARESANVEEASGVDTFAMYDMEPTVEVREPGKVYVRSDMRQQRSFV